jgi:Acetyltransferase (GNAT) domain
MSVHVAATPAAAVSQTHGSVMTVYQIDPLQDRRWTEFVGTHPCASVFHTPGWLESLRRTYGYEPFVLTTTPPQAQLSNGLVFCRIRSWLTGERIVSIPFADHCQPLFDQIDDFYAVLEWLGKKWGTGRRYVEIRPRDSGSLALSGHPEFRPGRSFRLHLLDLRPSCEDLLRSFDKNSVQRRLRRVERENLTYEEGNSEVMLRKFYHLQVLTRRKHQIVPQPISWFRNLINLLGERTRIRVVSKDKVPIASILTLTCNGSVIYKYGCSDARFNNLAGTPLLFWRTIQEAKEAGVHTFDMGRSDLDNHGLIHFKSNWGTADLPLVYWRCPASEQSELSSPSAGRKVGGYIVSRLPDSLLILLGRTLYKHVG